MKICHNHNLNRTLDGERLFGIRVSLDDSDPFGRLLGADWRRFHWYKTAKQRDYALKEMSREHVYSRRGDRPIIILEPVARSSNSGSTQ